MALTNEFRPYPTTSTSAFGRLFVGMTNRVLFSQLLIDDINVLGKCYQNNDPTSSEVSDLLATDGGEIPLQNSGNIIKLVEYQRGVLAFCDLGVWYISGPDGGFTADSYTVEKITEDSLYAINSVSIIGSVLFYCSEEGIIALESNEFGSIKPTNITESVIDSFYKELLNTSLRSIYEPTRKQLWYYSTRDNLAMIHDLRVNAFYPQEFSLAPEEKIVSAYRIPGDPYVKFLYENTTTDKYNILELKDETFEDVGNSYSSYLVTAEENLGKFSNSKDVRNIYAIFNKTEETILSFDGTDYVYDKPSGCEFRAEFDYAGSHQAGTYTPIRQIYKPNRRNYIPNNSYPVTFADGRKVVEYRDILRGNGNSVRFRFQSEANKDMQLLGYSVEYSMRGRQ